MRWMRCVVMIAIALLLALLVREYSHAPSEIANAPHLFIPQGSIDPERVDDVRLDRDGKQFHFERRGTSWWQTEPVEHSVDGWAVRQIVSRLLKTESVRTVTVASTGPSAEATLANAGFAPCAGRIEIREASLEIGAAAKTTVVELGKRSLAGRAYARVIEPSNAVDSFEVVDSTLHEYALERDPKDFRRRELFVDLGQVDRVTLSTGAANNGGEFVLSRVGREFQIDAPIHSRADRVACEELAEALKRARSTGFIVDKPLELAVFGLAPAVAKLTVESGDHTTSLLIGSEVSIGAQDRFGLIEGSESVVRLSAVDLASIVPKIEQLLDAVATSVRARDVGAIEIVSADGRILLRRESASWTATVTSAADAASPQRVGTVDASAVDRLLAALSMTRAGSVEIAAYPIASERARVTLLGFANEPLDTVRIARGVSSGGFILENGDGVLRIHGAIDLPIDVSELRFVAAPQETTP